MKVKQLMEMLQKFDPELPVFVNGYEGGYDTPQLPFQSPMKLNVHDYENEWYYGIHELHRISDTVKADCEAVIISR
jgi:hypothetical protein